jgi:Outer membrane efflux protein
MKYLIICIIQLCGLLPAIGQWSLDSCLSNLRQKGPAVQIATNEAKLAEFGVRQAIDLPPTQVYLESPTSQFMTPGIMQTVAYPGVYVAQARASIAGKELAKVNLELNVAQYEQVAMQWYLEAAYCKGMLHLYDAKDSMAQLALIKMEELRKAGGVNKIHMDQLRLFAFEANAEKAIWSQRSTEALSHLAWQCGINSIDGVLDLQMAVEQLLIQHADNIYWKQRADLELLKSTYEVKTAKRSALPGLMGGYLNQGNKNSPVQMRWQVGLSIPIAWWKQRADIQFAEQKRTVLEMELATWEQDRQRTLTLKSAQLQQFQEKILSQKEMGITDQSSYFKDAERLLEVGEISFLEFQLYILQGFDGMEFYYGLLRDAGNAAATMIYLQR